jgi:hypothetical protein
MIAIFKGYVCMQIRYEDKQKSICVAFSYTGHVRAQEERL